MSEMNLSNPIVNHKVSEDRLFKVKQCEQCDSLLYLYQETQERNKELEMINRGLRHEIAQLAKIETKLCHLKIDNGNLKSELEDYEEKVEFLK